MPGPFEPGAMSAETAAFNAWLRARLADLPRPNEVPVALTRAARAEGRGIYPLGGPRTGSDWAAIAGADGGPGRVRISGNAATARGTYLHLHGGGWTFNAPDQYDDANQALARAAGCRVVSPAYRLAPEHRWPAPAEDCLAAAVWALETGPGPLVIGGESAGAHLAVVTLLALAARGQGDRIAGAVLSYGMYDLRGTPSMRNWGEDYLVLSTPVIDWFVDNLLGGAPRGDPGVSPLLGDLGRPPSALFMVGTADPLIDDTLFMAARWRATGARAALDIHPGGVHAFDQFDLAIARAALARRHGFVAEVLSNWAADPPA